MIQRNSEWVVIQFNNSFCWVFLIFATLPLENPAIVLVQQKTSLRFCRK